MTRSTRALPVTLHEDGLAAALDIHRARLAACRACATGAVQGRPILSLARTPRVMLVGQAPGSTEAGGGRPFAGRAGKTLFRWLASVGIEEPAWRDEVYMAAITRCYPGPHPGGRGDRVPTPHERQACGGWLDAELQLIRPRLLVPVGRLAIDRFLRAAPLDRLVGRAHPVEHAGGRSVAIPLPHPSGASSWVHEAGNRGLLDRALALLAGELAEARCAA
jgi:uracil-DNA glycosylase